MNTQSFPPVLLLSAPSRAFNHFRPPLALMYLAGFLKHHGTAARIVDITQKHQIYNLDFARCREDYLAQVENCIMEEVRSTDADIVGISCYSPELAEVERLAARIRSMLPRACLIAGGIHPTLYPEDFLGPSSSFDYAVIGEGEETLLELIQGIRSRREDMDHVKGIGFFDRSTGKTVITAPRAVSTDLDSIAHPDYEGVDMDYYTTASPYAIRGVFSRSFYIISSRGCPSSCSFCVAKKLREYHGRKPFVRLRSPASLLNEIVTLEQHYAIDSFYFIDDLFTLKKSHVLEFCDRMKHAGSRLIWGCSSRVNTVDDEILSAMRNAGCVQIDFGVEQGSDEALARLKKGITIRQVKETFASCRALGIRTFANFLINTPGETEKDIEEIILLIEEIHPTIVSVNIFTPFPGCEIFDGMACTISREEYPLLMRSPAELAARFPEKFRFAVHSLEFGESALRMMKKFNRFGSNAAIFLDSRYFRHWLRSRRKSDYLRQLSNLMREFINQKF